MRVPAKKECEKVIRKADRLIDEVNCILKLKNKQHIQTICDWFDQDEIKELATKNQKIFILSMLTYIQRVELEEQVGRYLLEDRTVDELITLYKMIIMLCRRIEFDFPIDQQMDIWEYICQEQISMMALVGIVQSSSILLKKNKIIEGLKQVIQYGADLPK